jgi:hypothetical protein
VPRTCTVCDHSGQRAIDQALIAGTAIAALSAKYGLSQDALSRHRTNHIPALLAKAEAAPAVADDLLSQVRYLQSKALSILGQAEQAGDLKVALGAIREARGNLELLAKLLGELDERPQVNIMISPEWVQMRTIILAALLPHGEARTAVAAALARLEAS